MPARRFFVTDVHREGERVAIDGSDAHKIVNVLRLRSGDEIEIVDSAGSLFTATLESDGAAVHAVLRELRAALAPARLAIDVAQGIPKGQKMDFVVEKLGELGVRALLPLESERSVARGVGSAKLERWRRLARAASQQSGRGDVLAVQEPTTLQRLSASFGEYDVVLLPWEVAAPRPLRERLPALAAGARRVLVIVGPEGGFSHAEAEAARAAGAHLISLGPRILRTETAALAVVAILSYQFA
ncbi:MAG TPA: 16S rRNA (uracil(1498)-N(3))-methyltransferase [Candidatus Acidoferrales bacterium]|nr:16S rRNA (uracil(1498)-N(3))-methyltransferase [Candidatus Acidoferrales bacterium]